jgi:hypothetical protein
MKIKTIAIIVIAGVALLYRWQTRAAQNPEHIAHPTYLELRITMDVKNRNLEQVMFVETVNEKDCKRNSEDIVKKLVESEDANSSKKWVLKSSECKDQLAPRHALLFEDKMSNLTYLKIARGNRWEREARLILWGVSLEESNKICELTSSMQSIHSGEVVCVKGSQL